MPRRTCDGTRFLAAFRSAVANLAAHVDEVNALNVFPVPDGDTGSNMLATVRAALDAADALHIGPEADAGRVAHAVAHGALMGARGNSGVITSQILGGIAHALEGKRRFNGLDLAHALDAGTKKAYAAVQRPVEGTILTVIREASAAAIAAAERDNEAEAVLAATVEAAERSVAKTPTLLEVLREAKVVDSGGQGLFRLFEGAFAAVRGLPVDGEQAVAGPASGPPSAVTTPVLPGVGEETAYGYETVYLVHARPGERLDPQAIGAHLESIGDSVLVAGDDIIAKVHVHNDRPDAIIAYGLSVGTLTRITIENLDGQASEVREARVAAFIEDAASAAEPISVAASTLGDPFARLIAASTHAATAERVPATRMPLGVVAVAPSDGLAQRLAMTAEGFKEYVAFRVVHGGQTANPSTGELLDAVTSTPADELLILPNNPNVILAAKQVASMTDRVVHIVPTRNCAEGVAALLRLDPAQNAEENAEAMTAAARSILSLQVTEAVRDATVSGKKVKKGQTMVLDPDDGLLALDNDANRAVIAAFGRLKGGFEIVEVYYGAEGSLEDAEELASRIHEVAPGAEVEVLHGGQPHYRYLISAE
jgi:DAK2 domain fusion protein YloV